MSVNNNSLKSNPLVSIILPAYQAEETIADVIQSVISQTYSHWELIIVNDGCTDDTVQTVQQFIDKRIKIISQKNSGVASARNTGIKKANGTYIAFIDSDDIWLPWKLEAEINCLKEHQVEECLVYSGYYAINSDGNLLNIPKMSTKNGMVADKILNNEGVLLPSTVMVHKNIVEEIGGFKSSCYHEDRAWFIEAVQRYPAFSTRDYLVLYQQSPAGRCRKVLSNYQNALLAEFSILEAVRDKLNKTQQFKLYQKQCQFLLHRFMMYGYFEDAQKFSEEYPHALKGKGKKSLLAALSLKTGRNLMLGSRLIIQTLMINLVSPLWKIRLNAKINQRLSQKAVNDLSSELPLLGNIVQNN